MAGTGDQPKISGLTPSNSLENGEHFHGRGGGGKPTAGEEQGSGDRKIQVPILAQPPPSSAPCGKLLDLFKAQFSYL